VQLWKPIPEWMDAKEKEGPSHISHRLRIHGKSDLNLFKMASSGFSEEPSGGRTLKRALRKSTSKQVRLPLGLLMMAGYGIGNAIIEIDTSVETTALYTTSSNGVSS
jgi:hypothetical protein